MAHEDLDEGSKSRTPRKPIRAGIMRPLTVLLGIVMGSAVSLAVGLLLTWITTLFLPRDAVRFAPEQLPLLRAVVVFTLFSAAASAAFYGDLRRRAWRLQAYAATLVMFGVAVWLYWPSR